MRYRLAVIYNKLGFKKLAVRKAIKVDTFGKHGNDAWDLIWHQTAYPTCPSCYWPILPRDPHTSCEEFEKEREEAERAEEEASWEAYQAELAREAAEEDEAAWLQHQEWLASRCNYPQCDEEATIDGCCVTHAQPEEPEDDFIEDRDDEECPGGCGQPAYACTCAELESLRRHNADPATRGSWWVA